MRQITLLVTSVLLILVSLAARGVAASPAPLQEEGRGDGQTDAAPTPTLAVLTAITLGSKPRGVAVDSSTGRVYVGLHDAGNSANVAVIDGETMTQLNSLGSLGSHPNAVAVNSTTHQVYVTNRDSGTLSIIDPATGLSRLVTVGATPWGLAVHPQTNRVFVANFGSNSITVVDGTAASVFKTTGNIYRPAFVCVDAVNNSVYISADNTGLFQVSAATGDVTLGPTPVGAAPRGVAFNPVTGLLYVVNNDTAHPTLWVRDPLGGLTHIALPHPPVNVAVNPTTNHIFVTLVSQVGLSLLLLDGDTNVLGTPLWLSADDVNQGGQGLAVDPMLNRIYVTGYQSGKLFVINDAVPAPTATPTRTNSPTALPSATATRTRTRTATATNIAPTATPTASASPTATATVPAATPTPTRTATLTPLPMPTGTVGIVFTTTVGIHPQSLAVDATRHHVYVTMILENIVKVIDGGSGAPIKDLATGGNQANGVTVNEQTGMVFVTNRVSGNISVINPDSGAAQTEPSGFFPWGIAVDSANNRVYAANFGTDDGGYTVAVFDATTAQPITTTVIGKHPALVAANPTSGRAYVTMLDASPGTFVLDTEGNIVDFLSTGSGSFGVAVNATTGRVYVTNQFDQKLHMVDPGSSHTAVPLGAKGYGVAVNAATNHVFIVVISDGQATLQVRDGASGALLASVPLGAEDAEDGGQGIAVDAALGRVYVVSYQTGVLTALRDAVALPTPTASVTPSPSITPSPSVTPLPTDTPTITSTPTESATPTPANTPVGGWTYRAYLPVIVVDPPPTPTVTPTVTKTATQTAIPAATATRTITVTPGPSPTWTGVDWRIPDILHMSVSPANVTSGQVYWRLTRAIYQDPTESDGNHNVYYRLEDENGQSLLGLHVCLGFSWLPYQDCSKITEQRSGNPDGYSADLPIWASVPTWDPLKDHVPGPYSGWAGGLPSDRVVGMGLPLNQHVNFLLTFRRTVAP